MNKKIAKKDVHRFRKPLSSKAICEKVITKTKTA